jgi:hypothetical protein
MPGQRAAGRNGGRDFIQHGHQGLKAASLHLLHLGLQTCRYANHNATRNRTSTMGMIPD